MKISIIKRNLYILALIPFWAYSQSTVSVDQEEVTPASSEKTMGTDQSKAHILDKKDTSTAQLYLAYKRFTQRRIKEVKLILLKNDFAIVREKSLKLTPRGSVDSLIFGNSNKDSIIFVMVDLGYLKNISASIILKSENPTDFIREFQQVMTDDGLSLNEKLSIADVCAEFRSQEESWVVDRRWQRPTYTKFEFLYNHFMSRYNDCFMINFNETIPEELVALDINSIEELKTVTEVDKNSYSAAVSHEPVIQ